MCLTPWLGHDRRKIKSAKLELTLLPSRRPASRVPQKNVKLQLTLSSNLSAPAMPLRGGRIFGLESLCNLCCAGGLLINMYTLEFVQRARSSKKIGGVKHHKRQVLSTSSIKSFQPAVLSLEVFVRSHQQMVFRQQQSGTISSSPRKLQPGILRQDSPVSPQP